MIIYSKSEDQCKCSQDQSDDKFICPAEELGQVFFIVGVGQEGQSGGAILGAGVGCVVSVCEEGEVDVGVVGVVHFGGEGDLEIGVGGVFGAEDVGVG